MLLVALVLLLPAHLVSGADPVLPSDCTGKFIGNFADAVGKFGKTSKRVMPVVSPCGGADKPNPKACPKCTGDGKDWSIMDPQIACPTEANACSKCPGSFKPHTCMAICNLFGQFKYAGVEGGDQCFCGDDLPAKAAGERSTASCTSASQLAHRLSAALEFHVAWEVKMV